MNKLKLEELIKSYSGEKLADLLFQAGFEKNTKSLDGTLPADDIFSSSLQLGEIKTNDNQKVLVVETKVSSDLSERSSRKKQFDIGKKLLQNNQAYAAGLLVFYDEKGNFRLSLVHPKFEGTKRSYNSFKRYTFYVNPAHSNKTFINQFSGASFATLGSIKEVFSVAKVTFDFFKEYKRLFEQIVESIKKDEHFPDFAGKNGVTINDVAKKLLGQIVFLYFLQRKGWLGATKGQHVSKGDQNFLRTLFNKAKEAEVAHSDTQMNFFNDYLEYLFYDALNKPITDSATSCYRQRFDCQIPFLNGGLFEPIPEYKWQQRFLQLPDDIFSNKNETGVLDIFDSYNFTIDENSADDQEVSVDPEMLGKVFENLLEENLRKGTGSFYTPREIVQYMVTESLKQYLRDKTDIAEEKIAAVLEEYHNECEVSEDEAEKIDNALKEVRVVDPACGSGAFLVGLLQEIAHIRHYCQRCYQTEPQTYYQIKKEIIRDSIYGVDLDGGAVDIARLRFWLSMVVDHDIDIDDIEPLPNLDYKLMQGNSLLEDMYVGDIKIKLDFDSGKKIDRRTKQAKMFDDGEEDVETQTLGFSEDTGDRIADKLVRHHNEFFAEKDPIKKAQLKKKIDSLESELIVAGHDDAVNALDSQLKNSQKEAEKRKIVERIVQVKFSRENWLKFKIRPYFPWRLHFSEVFENGGFDIVIGNPPYGFRDVLSKEEKVYFRKVEKIEFKSGDSAELFCRKTFDRLVRDGGVLSFIIPKKCTYGDSWGGWRDSYLQKYSLHFVLDSGKAFDNVLLEQTAFLLTKQEQKSLVSLSILDNRTTEILTFKKTPKEALFKENGTLQMYLEFYPRSIYEKVILASEVGAITGNLGLGIGTDFFSDEETDYKLLKGIDIQRWHVRSNRYLKNKDKLNWKNASVFLSPKIVAQVLVAHIENPVPHIKITACYDTEGIIITNTLTSFEHKENINTKFLLGYLNTEFASWFAYNYIYGRAVRTMHLYNFYIEQIPVPKFTKEEQEDIAELVSSIEKLKSIDPKADVSKLEEEIEISFLNHFKFSKEELSTIRNT